MNLRLSVTIPNYPFKINHADRLFSIGSCFAEHIGQRLAARKFSLISNPFGILYNPASIQMTLQMLLEDYQFSERDFFQQNELWHSYYHHGQFSKINLAEAIDHVQIQANKARNQLLQSNRLLITLGTAQVYELKRLEKIVANCHKLPQREFIKKRLSTTETVTYLQPILEQLQAQNVDFQCIITVSPVRHWRDGLIENQRSKAVLLLAVEQLAQTLDYVHYFPAYELVMDDLRDYRFYKKDLAHPNELAQDYVWQHFQAAFFNESTQQLNQRIEKLLAAQQHRPLHPQTDAHQQFRMTQLEKTQALQRAYPNLSFTDLLRFFR